MAAPHILIVDDQRDILRLIHATLDTLGHKLEIHEAPSGEEALLATTRHRIDLLISDYKLPGITGVELMSKVRAKNPELKSILITAMTDRRSREEMLAAGAVAMFDKPIPLADFLDVVERSLDLKRTILPREDDKPQASRGTLGGLLTKLRKDVKAQAVYLLSDRGRVLERAGDLYDSSMEVSLVSAIMAIFGAGQRVSRFIHQDGPNHYHVFRGGDHDLLLVPVNSLYGLLVAGDKLATRENVVKVVESMLASRDEMQKALRSIGAPTVAADASEAETYAPVSATTNVPTQDIANLLTQAGRKKIKARDADAFWDNAVEKHGNPPLQPDVLSYEQAKQLGLTPTSEMKPAKPKK